MGFGFNQKKKKEIARWVPIERNSDFKRVESTSPVFFGFGNPETSYSTRIRCQTVNDSNESRDKVVSPVRCSLSTFRKLKTPRKKNSGRRKISRRERRARRERERKREGDFCY